MDGRLDQLLDSGTGRSTQPHSLPGLIRDIGIPGTAVRTAALSQLVLQARIPVIARAVGFHDTTATRVVARLAGPEPPRPDDREQ
ncbi:hypothetical protein CDO52_15745 [Nocardiopsis gilva YIM 90087]|uniref:Uncharacterized protein n=1 Tax=Nocardiopsis gilva YIM 90087 TaxID=1235441 RepID=A0A223S7I9_9ACTN|nr:hypothetical protein [Nocardiopsis gilva]ASU84049.1 hypothetical protein CDO52_15745 [Nocardiopsis gilva YIM 90087]